MTSTDWINIEADGRDWSGAFLKVGDGHVILADSSLGEPNTECMVLLSTRQARQVAHLILGTTGDGKG